MSDDQAKELSSFRINGYQIFENVIPHEIIQEINSFLSSKILATLEIAKSEIKCKSVSDLIDYSESFGSKGVSLLSTTTKQVLSGHFSLDTRLSQTLWKIPLSVDFQKIVRLLLGSDEIFMHMPPTARFVLPGNTQAAVPPHQDISYNRHMSNFVTVWVPLIEITEKCGGVIVFPGNNVEEVSQTGNTGSSFWQDAVPTNEMESVHCLMKEGSILALNKYTIHKSATNLSHDIRISIDFRFFGKGDSSAKHFLDLKTLKVCGPDEDLM